MLAHLEFILQIFAIINCSLFMNSGKNPQYDFPKMMEMRIGTLKYEKGTQDTENRDPEI